MKFDNVIGNPPYHKNRVGSGGILWHRFVEEALMTWLCNDGFLSFVHPSLWRKPQTDQTYCIDIQNHIFTKQFVNINMNNTDDGYEMLNAGTRFDYYLLANRKCEAHTTTTIIDECDITHNIDIQNWPWLPNSHFSTIKRLLINVDDQPCCPVVPVSFIHESSPDHISNVRTSIFQYELVNTTPNTGTRFKYTDINTKGHFGVSKVIMSETNTSMNPVIDMSGRYGMTRNAFAIRVDTKHEAQKIVKALKSDIFNNVVLSKACSWSNYRIDWRMFKDFKKNWYEEILRIENE